MAAKKTDFETSIKRLEEIVSKLERGDASLEESLTLFEEGTSLVKSCTKLLDEAEQKVTKLSLTSEGELEEVPFDMEE